MQLGASSLHAKKIVGAARKLVQKPAASAVSTPIPATASTAATTPLLDPFGREGTASAPVGVADSTGLFEDATASTTPAVAALPAPTPAQRTVSAGRTFVSQLDATWVANTWLPEIGLPMHSSACSCARPACFV